MGSDGDVVVAVDGLRKEFTVRIRAGRFRRQKRLVTAVDGIDLTVRRGEMVGYIGPNGAGKSTTLKMLTGVLAPSAGAVRVCGLAPVPQRTRLALRIGVVFGQRSHLGSGGRHQSTASPDHREPAGQGLVDLG